MSDTNLNNASFTPEINDSEESTNKQTYSATGSFRFWCQKVLPLVYDDSLSYYELLCKVVNYLNSVIQNVDNLNTSVDNTNTAFNNLQNYVNTTKDTLVEVYGELEQYVNDYFNNLDVQEEINSKLDSMAKDGSLSTIISPFIPAAVSDWLSNNITPTSPAIDASLSVSGAGADAKVTGDRLSKLNAILKTTNDNLPWYDTFPTSIFSHGQVAYGSGAWSDTITRWGTKDLQHTDKDLYLSIKEYDPELNYQICYFDENGTYKSWSGWKNAESEEYIIPANSYYKITISRIADSSDTATVDYIYQLRINTGLSEGLTDVSRLKEQAVNIISGFRVTPQWVRGYRASTGGRPTPTPDQMSRFITTYEPMYLYKGSYIYCDTVRLYRHTLIHYSDPEGNKVISYSSNVVPMKSNMITIDETGYYGINIQKYDGSRVDISDLNEHVTMALYSNKENPIYAIFVGGGKANFQAPGDANLVIGKTGKTIMIDSGLNNTENQILSCMRSNGIESPDYIIISHMHDDHIGALVKLLDNNIFTLNNKTIFLPAQNGIDYAIEHNIMGENSTELYNKLMEYINSATDLTVIRPSAEYEEYNIDGMTIKFWNVNHQQYIDMGDTNYNDFSLCNNIEYGNERICYTGDLGPIGMGVNAGKNYKCNIYKAQHHGWDNITADSDILNLKKWMSTVFPEIVVTEDGISHDNLLQGNGAPMPDWCEDNGIPFYRTNQNGFVYVRVSQDSFDILTPVIRWTKSENLGN